MLTGRTTSRKILCIFELLKTTKEIKVNTNKSKRVAEFNQPKKSERGYTDNTNYFGEVI